MNLSLNEFWKMTPYEFFILVESYTEREEERGKEGREELRLLR